MKFSLMLALAFAMFAGPAGGADLDTCPGGSTASPQRYLAVISDVHLGNGRRADGTWDPTEDFRWDGALESFLARVDACGGSQVDLVIAGDLLELWQPPEGLRCASEDGCTVQEMERMARHVTGQHPRALAALKSFAENGGNRLHVLPGNHDSTLLLPKVWDVLDKAIGAAPGRVNFVSSGAYLSHDGTVLVEHGHQIGTDVNSYRAWPQILRESKGKTLVEQPWGENFVQSIYNAEEENYPIIDNLSPESAGVRYRMADRGAWRTAGDMARFLAFNLFETSIAQKVKVLGKPGEEAKWDLETGRKLGYRLFANALPTDDPFRGAILAKDAAALELQAALNALAADAGQLKDADVELLCDQAAIRNPSAPQCVRGNLGSAVEKLLVPRKRVMQDYLRARRAQPGMDRVQVFIYGHTHLYENGWPVALNAFVEITVLNAGAFQRVVGEDGFLARVAKQPGLTPAQALRAFRPEDLAPCYGAVLVPFPDGKAKPLAVDWYASEGQAGRFVATNDAGCE